MFLNVKFLKGFIFDKTETSKEKVFLKKYMYDASQNQEYITFIRHHMYVF